MCPELQHSQYLGMWGPLPAHSTSFRLPSPVTPTCDRYYGGHSIQRSQSLKHIRFQSGTGLCGAESHASWGACRGVACSALCEDKTRRVVSSATNSWSRCLSGLRRQWYPGAQGCWRDVGASPRVTGRGWVPCDRSVCQVIIWDEAWGCKAIANGTDIGHLSFIFLKE